MLRNHAAHPTVTATSHNQARTEHKNHEGGEIWNGDGWLKPFPQHITELEHVGLPSWEEEHMLFVCYYSAVKHQFIITITTTTGEVKHQLRLGSIRSLHSFIHA
jgi:hypothetical protein